MICHYRGVSTQLSPPNHPSYPLSHPPPSPTKLNSRSPLHSSGSSGFTRSTATPSAPPSYSLPWEKTYPCERRSTLNSLFGCAMCAYTPMCVSTQFTCVHTCLSRGRAAHSDTRGEQAEQNFASGEALNWSGLQSRNKTPRRQTKHKKKLSQVYYICQQRSFTTTGQRSHSFPLNAVSFGTCKCVR